MDLITSVLKQNGGQLVSALMSGGGMGREEAEAFLPEAGSSLVGALTDRAELLDLGNLPSQGNVNQLLRAMDASKLASRIGVTPEQSSKGLAAFLPMALGFLKDSNADDLLALLGKAEGLGGAIGKLKGLGKLFG